MEMDYQSLRGTADSLIDMFSKKQSATLLKGEKKTDPKTGRVTKSWREVDGGLAVMTSYSEEAIGKSDSVIQAGDVKFVCRFSEKPTEAEDRVRYAGVDYNIIHCRPIDPTGAYIVTYVLQGRKA